MPSESANMHPYAQFPDRQFWRKAVSTAPWADVFAHERPKFLIQPGERIVSAGSCFAQRIARHLSDIQYGYEVFETCHPLLAPQSAALGYETFSCRYGNLYTMRQLRQLVEEAFGLRPPILEFDTNAQGAVLDLMRPNINTVGFEHVSAAAADRLYHLQRVREMFLHADQFIFTLGLTEAWMAPDANVVFGSHPSTFTKQAFRTPLVPVNFDYVETLADFMAVHQWLAKVNPKLKFLLTVSPVGLAATHQDQHVLLATSYSKSVLRAVAGRLADQLDNVQYFPSFEIFSLSQSFGQFLADDLRDVNLRGVQVAMRTFNDLFIAPRAPTPADLVSVMPAAPAESASTPAVNRGADVECDEVANAFFSNAH